jgi:hypothetical protein
MNDQSNQQATEAVTERSGVRMGAMSFAVFVLAGVVLLWAYL